MTNKERLKLLEIFPCSVVMNPKRGQYIYGFEFTQDDKGDTDWTMSRWEGGSRLATNDFRQSLEILSRYFREQPIEKDK